MRRRVLLVAGALLLTACTGSGPPKAGTQQRLAPADEVCWGSYSAEGRNGPFECAGDGVTPIYSRPLPWPAPMEGPIPCPVLQNPGGDPVTYQEPCSQRRDAQDPVVTRIYDGNGMVIGGSTP